MNSWILLEKRPSVRASSTFTHSLTLRGDVVAGVFAAAEVAAAAAPRAGGAARTLLPETRKYWLVGSDLKTTVLAYS